MYIAESVTRCHPDKICDIISDAILDECLRQDPDSRVAVETTGGHGLVVLVGEITTKADVDYRNTARDTYRKLSGRNIDVLVNITTQSPDISNKVDNGGAGDQGIMIGYACNDNEEYIPQEIYLARKLLKDINVDGKSQVMCTDRMVYSVVLSVQGKEREELEEIVKSVCDPGEMYCNNIGRFDIGGFDADSGCTGRKIVVDAYGPRVPVGGGAFSGKDPSKVDRSAAYMARYIAKHILQEYSAKEVLVKLGYVIGQAEPLLREIYINGRLMMGKFEYDCRPQAIIERFSLKRPIYKQTATSGHFGNKDYPWEQ